MNIATAPNAAIPVGIRRKQAFDAEAKTLYVHRPVKNAEDILAWAKDQGFKTTLSPDDFHVTVAFSKTPVDWNGAPDGFDSEIVPAAADQKNGERSVEKLGDKGAVVLRFESTDLASRWQQFRRTGASWDHDGYRPHVTISYDAGDVDLSKVEPYAGPIELGEEVFQEVDPKWIEKAKASEQAADSAFLIAMDRDSVREKTRDGRLIVKKTHISKANVCPYRGEEVPGWEKLGLDPEKIYNLLRDPDELKKAAPTLNGVQLLIKHVPVNADDHRPNETVGSLGTDAEFDGEYLNNSLFVNAKHAIDAIESGQQRELSAGYHYVPDMTPGNFRGTAFDGVMREIVFNHVALVEDGRAGPDVLVGDSALKEKNMKATRFGARTLSITAAAIAPLLAMDSKVKLSKDLFAPLTSKNFKDNREKLLAGVKIAVDGKLRKGLALDASMKGVAKVFDAFEKMNAEEMDKPDDVEASDEDVDPMPMDEEKDDKPKAFDAEPMKAFLKEKGMGEDDISKCMDMMPKNGLAGDADETDEEKSAREAKEKQAKDEAAEKDKKDKENMGKDTVTKPAMDAALKAQSDAFQKEIVKVRDNERGVRVAIAEVHPWTGDLPATMAFDSASDVYRKALEMRGVDGAKTLHADALLPILKTLPKNGARNAEHQTTETLGMDSSIIAKAINFAPGIENIEIM